MIREQSVLFRFVAAVVMAAALVVATVALWVKYAGQGDGDIADDALINASSVARGSIVRQVTNPQHSTAVHRGWHSDGETTGAWIQFTWSSEQRVRRITLERNPLAEPGATEGYFVFGDGSQLQVRLSTTGRTTVIPFTPRSVQTLRFVVSAVSPGASAVFLSRVRIYTKAESGDVGTHSGPQGNSAAVATLSASRGSLTTLTRLVDGQVATAWALPAPTGASVLLRWKQPRELKSVIIAGARSSASLRRGTLSFSDGSRLTVGAVGTDAYHPTTISFMPRVTSWLRLTIGSVHGTGTLALAEISAYRLDATASVPAGAASTPSYRTASACPTSPARPSDDVGVVARCPVDGSQVADSATLQLTVAAPYTAVRTQVTPSSATTPTPAPIDSTPSAAGTLNVPLDLSALPAGPFALVATATGLGVPDRSVVLHLDKKTGTALRTSSALAPGSGPAKGRSLVFDDEFSRVPAITQLGHDADYAAGKPGASTVEDFGDAIFAPPEAGLGNARMVDNAYLKLSVQPRPADYPDPAGYGRDYVGALVSSAGAGGTGFSAQYGYFEARMLAPASPGTWPAFWMLPSTNLIAPQPVVAEIDAAELYGQKSTGACESTHQFENGRDGGVARCGTRWSSEQAAAGWHTYGVSIEPTVVQFYIDDQLVVEAPAVKGGSEPMFFMLDLALGGGWPVNLASTNGLASLYIDYVRVYV